MADVVSKSFDTPDDVVEFPSIRSRIVELGDLTVGELVSQPGWRWSAHVRPTVAGSGEILVSELTRALAGASGLRFEDRGLHEFKGLEGEWRLAAFAPEQ